ncbi:MAG: single-stranded-DNA-specific exonuclease RecJ [Chloroflexota bacterium]|nr:MAG: single-stranded-DNA-specific exonuclease RecJ [Chloroflexota bacterium]
MTYPAAERAWHLPEAELPIAPDILAACDFDELIATILLRRGFNQPSAIRAFLDPSFYTPAPPESLPDLTRASELLAQTVRRKGKILIWGDFDVDGQTATALLVDALQRLGAHAVYYVPQRATESHGIKVERLQALVAQHQPDLLLTCDTGVSEHSAVETAQALGLPVIITDHHELGESLPRAQAVVNPKRLPLGHPLRTLPGVGVAFKLVQHLFAIFGQTRHLGALLDLVALGIVCDVAEQVGDTRHLLQLGMDHLRLTERIGLQELLRVAKLPPETLTAERLGFTLGPRLNAVGRLGDAMLAVELLTTRDRPRAALIAGSLERLNVERRLLSRQVEEAARAMLEADRSLLQEAALVLHQPEWHVGVLGGVAGNLAERYARPVVLLGGNGAIVSGSARTFGDLDIYAALAQAADLLHTFGGHRSAAGLSLAVQHVPALRKRLSNALLKQRPEALQVPPLHIDMLCSLATLDTDFAKRLQRLGPFGEGNPPVVLATSNLHVSHAATFGRDNEHLRIVAEDEDGRTLPLIVWRGADLAVPEGRFDAAYTLSLDAYGQLEAALVGLQRHAPIVVESESALQVHDWRRDSDPFARLEALRAELPEAQVWAEAYNRLDFPHFQRRAQLSACKTLIIFTAPPDLETLRAALSITAPQSVHVIGAPPPLVRFEDLLRQLTLALKNALTHFKGTVGLAELCGAVAASPEFVRRALDFLAAEGRISYQEDSQQRIQLAHPEAAAACRAESEAHLKRMRAAYEEMEAFRRYFSLMPLKLLLKPSSESAP